MKIRTNYKIIKDELIDKVILVTGANTGFGKAITIDLAKAGATVIMLGRNLAELEDVYDIILKLKYQEPILYPLDLAGAEPKHYQDLQTNILKKFNKLDGLVHNAAILGTMMPIDQYDIKIWYETIQINLHAPFMLSQFLIPVLNKSSDARVIFLSSTVGRQARAYWGAYGVSKFGIEALAKTMAEELEHTNIKVNTLNPNKMKTTMRKNAYPAENTTALPLPEDKSPAVVYLFNKTTKNINSKQLEL